MNVPNDVRRLHREKCMDIVSSMIRCWDPMPNFQSILFSYLRKGAIVLLPSDKRVWLEDVPPMHFAIIST